MKTEVAVKTDSESTAVKNNAPKVGGHFVTLEGFLCLQLCARCKQKVSSQQLPSEHLQTVPAVSCTERSLKKNNQEETCQTVLELLVIF
jgi:hypothetical protein